MKNKFLNIIGIIGVIIAIAITIFIKKEETMLGKFNLNALENAEQIVNDSVAKARKETEDLVSIKDKTYMNFLRPLMDIDAKLQQITFPIYHLNDVNNSLETQKIVDAILPVLSNYSSDMVRHKGIYNGVLYIKKNEYETLNFEQKKVVDDSIKGFEIAGVALPEDKQKQLKEIASKLSKLSNDFSNNIIAANKKNKILITDENILGEMPASDKTAAKTKDGWEFSLLAPSFIPFMKYVTDRKLREEMYKNSSTRAPENEKLIPEILKLRNEKAKILGFKNYADLAFQFRDAKLPATAEKYLYSIAEIAKPAAQKEFSELKEFSKIDIESWDIAYYSRILQKERYSLDEAETKPYFEMNETIDGVMSVISEILDIKFKPRNADIWDPNVRYFDVLRDNKIIAGLYLDLQTRESKKSGAWANNMSVHHRDKENKEHLAEAIIVANFPVGTKDNPSLLTLNDLSTLFHEMGHAVHLMLSTVDERDVSGYDVDWDVVEFPSQFLESFWLNKTVLKKIGKHYKTGEIIPDDLIERVIAADHFQKGMHLVRQLEFGIFDLELYQKENLTVENVQSILDDVRKRVAVIKIPDYNKFQNTFSHIFVGGYAAGYYSYLWAESLAADAYMAFDGNPFNKELAHKYRDTVLAFGDSKPMSELYIEFLGRNPKPESLLQYYGLK
ncbi:MAG: M3 family metallopeptidase [Alphaproteobacteria bacterium]|nr:M3 family metallopeptidase [Alphaproteobacteria bacterium]MBN2675467.1 M3 family metallopeptidase [Alphaproteobacteria bacterium]